MFVVRTATQTHATTDAARAYACLRELERTGQSVVVTDGGGRFLDAARLATIAAADEALRRPH